VSRWNHPAYNLADKAIVTAVVVAFLLVYSTATGAPLTAGTVGVATASAVGAGLIVAGLLRVTAGAES